MLQSTQYKLYIWDNTPVKHQQYTTLLPHCRKQIHDVIAIQNQYVIKWITCICLEAYVSSEGNLLEIRNCDNSISIGLCQIQSLISSVVVVSSGVRTVSEDSGGKVHPESVWESVLDLFENSPPSPSLSFLPLAGHSKFWCGQNVYSAQTHHIAA